MAELVISAMPKLLLTGRYEAQETEVGGVAVAGTDEHYVLNASYYILPNVNLSTEFSRTDKGQSAFEEDRFILGFKVGI